MINLHVLMIVLLKIKVNLELIIASTKYNFNVKNRNM